MINRKHQYRFGAHQAIRSFYIDIFPLDAQVSYSSRFSDFRRVYVKPDTSAYACMEDFAYSSVGAKPASYVRFETAQFSLALQSGMPGIKGFLTRLASSNITIGDDHDIEIISIQKVFNYQLEMDYHKKQFEIARQINTQGGVNERASVRTHGLIPECDPALNETVLFHGLNPKFLDAIIQNGLNPAYCMANKYTGFGPLGKGVYLTDSFAKAVLYSKCSICFKDKCDCILPDGTSPERAVLVCKVTMGDVFNQPYKVRYRYFDEQIPENRHSVVAPDDHTDPRSPFDHTEIVINHKSQMKPFYIIRYHIGLNPKCVSVEASSISDKKFDLTKFLVNMHKDQLCGLYTQLKKLSLISVKTSKKQLTVILDSLPDEIKQLIIERNRILRINQARIRDIIIEVSRVLLTKHGIRKKNYYDPGLGHLFFDRIRSQCDNDRIAYTTNSESRKRCK